MFVTTFGPKTNQRLRALSDTLLKGLHVIFHKPFVMVLEDTKKLCLCSKGMNKQLNLLFNVED